MNPLRRVVSAVLFLLFVATAALADDPPARVARLKYIDGEVSVQPRGVDDWVKAAINRPMTTSDRVWTDRQSRAELHLGTAALRMNDETSLTLTNLTDNTVQVELDQGTLNLRVVHLYDGEIYEVDTPNLAFTVTKSGNYRFDVDANGDTTLVTVWKGEGEATGDAPAVRVHSGQQARFSNGRSLTRFFSGLPGLDGFDSWARVRDEREDRVQSARYVSRGVVGYEDLDEYGHWVNAPPYGWVWEPYSVVAGWAPYRYGHWIWLEPWGWTWVDDAPWGFAPFHYGRWIYRGAAWCWAPGPRYYRPVWAPALVAWIGGPHWGFSIGFGAGVGWFPLGWGDPYIPYYHVSRPYFRQINITNTRITNITYVTNNYYNNPGALQRVKWANGGMHGAVTTVSADTLVQSRPVSRGIVRVPPEQLRNAPISAGAPVSPTRASVLGPNADAAAPHPNAPNGRAAFKSPPPPRPVPFAQREALLQSDPGRPLDSAAEARLRSASGGVSRATPRGEAAPGTPAASDAASRSVHVPDNGAREAGANGAITQPRDHEAPGAAAPGRSANPRDAANSGNPRVPRPPERSPENTGVARPNAPAPETRVAETPRVGNPETSNPRTVHRPPARNMDDVSATGGGPSARGIDARTPREAEARPQPSEPAARPSHAVPRPPEGQPVREETPRSAPETPRAAPESPRSAPSRGMDTRPPREAESPRSAPESPRVHQPSAPPREAPAPAAPRSEAPPQRAPEAPRAAPESRPAPREAPPARAPEHNDKPAAPPDHQGARQQARSFVHRPSVAWNAQPSEPRSAGASWSGGGIERTSYRAPVSNSFAPSSSYRSSGSSSAMGGRASWSSAPSGMNSPRTRSAPSYSPPTSSAPRSYAGPRMSSGGASTHAGSTARSAPSSGGSRGVATASRSHQR